MSGRPPGSSRGGKGSKRASSSAAAHPAPATGKLDVTTVEDELQANLKKSASMMISKLSLADALPIRPGYGTQGEKINVHANYFPLHISMNLVLHSYDVQMVPISGATKEEPVGKKREHIMRLFLETHLKEANCQVFTDFRTTILSDKALEDGAEYQVAYLRELDDNVTSATPFFKITVKSKGVLDVSELLKHVTSTNVDNVLNGKETYIQALDILVGHHPKSCSNVVSIGSNRHFAVGGPNKEVRDLGCGLEMLRGYFISARLAATRVLLNVQVANLACHKPGSLADLMDDVFNYFPKDKDASKDAAKDAAIRHLHSGLKGVRVDALHIDRRNSRNERIPRIKTIFGLAVSGTGSRLDHQVKFIREGTGFNGSQIEFWHENDSNPGYRTVLEHFRLAHTMAIKRPDLPVVNVGTAQNPSFLLPEFCRILPGQPMKQALLPPQRSKMIEFSVRRPEDNLQSIRKFGAAVIGLGPNSNPSMSKIGITCPSVDPVSVQSRILKTPKVYFARGSEAATANGKWNMRDVQFSQGARLKKWAVIYLHHSTTLSIFPTQASMEGAVVELQKEIKKCGINITPETSRMIHVVKDNAQRKDNLKKLLSELLVQSVQFVLVVGPEPDKNSEALYRDIKKMTDVTYGIPSIYIRDSVLAKKDPQTNANIALKINACLGGINQALSVTNLRLLAEGKTMVMGVDVTHPTNLNHESAAPSIAAVVASIDGRMSHWPGAIRLQSASRVEMVSALEEMTISRLKLWQKARQNQAYPENIIIFRDGVSEGQYQQVLEVEVPQIRAACTKLYPATQTKMNLPRLTVIVCGKRHHTRFYPIHKSTKNGNVPCGTVVDRGITEGRNWDFFLVAHDAIKGTARPCHYQVVLDEIFSRSKTFKPPCQNAADELETLVLNLSHILPRANRSISYCGPAYMADLLADRARLYVEDFYKSRTEKDDRDPKTIFDEQAMAIKVHDNIKDTMFYI